MEQEPDGSTTSTAVIAEERMEESDNCREEFFSCGEDSQSSSPCDSPWNFPRPPEYYREWDGQHVMMWNEITDSDPPSSASSPFSSLSRSSSMIENLDDFIEELSLELAKLLEARDMLQTKFKEERKKNPMEKAIIDEVESWFIHADKSFTMGIKRLLRWKFLKLLHWNKKKQNRDAYKKKKVILELTETFLKLKNQAKDLVDCIAHHSIKAELKQLKVQTSYFSLREIKIATDNLDPRNEIGKDGNYTSYKGVLQDGSIVAVKQFDNRGFVNEVGIISALQHPNLVKLFGCCTEGRQLLLVYEYMENNSLAHALFESSRLKLDWRRRRKISLDIARGLSYLHKQKIVRITIKARNILLDKHLDAKISDFRLAKLYDEESSHISSPICGAIGYTDPEYFISGHLTEKVDVYNYGVVLLEIISGKSITHYLPKEDFLGLLDWARAMKDQGNLLDLVDPNMSSNFSVAEVEQMLNLAVLCINPSPTLRPTMTSVVCMIRGETHVTIP